MSLAIFWEPPPCEDLSVLSQTAEYALRATLYLAERQRRRPVPVGQMARALGIPQNYLSKTLHVLARSGVLTSLRGKGGGFQLASPPERIPLLDVVAPFDRLEERRQCLLRRRECSDGRACAAHSRWKSVAGQVSDFFRITTIADITATASPAARRAARPKGGGNGGTTRRRRTGA
ncbi:MAG: Rrf2 family transcriptional regulator [Gemmatimonadota bacterium]